MARPGYPAAGWSKPSPTTRELCFLSQRWPAGTRRYQLRELRRLRRRANLDGRIRARHDRCVPAAVADPIRTVHFARTGPGEIGLGASGDLALLMDVTGDGGPTKAYAWNLRTGALTGTMLM